MSKSLKFAGVLASVLVFCALFIIYQHLPSERTVIIGNSNEIRNALSEGDTTTISLRSERKSIIVKSKSLDGLLSTDGDAFSFADMSSFCKGPFPCRQGDLWNYRQPVSNAADKVYEGEELELALKGPPPLALTVKTLGDQGLISSDGKVIAYNQIGSVTQKVGVGDRIARTLLSIPALILWVAVELMTMVFGP